MHKVPTDSDSDSDSDSYSYSDSDSYSYSGMGMRFCISNMFPGEVSSSGLGITLHVARVEKYS